VVCRYAGDEFIVILPDTDRAEAQETADRIKQAIDGYNPGFHHDQPVRVGVSVGVATYPTDGSDVRSLIGRADAAMYSDKRGRKAERRAA
jgi:two-component system cell cycle response regulator